MAFGLLAAEVVRVRKIKLQVWFSFFLPASTKALEFGKVSIWLLGPPKKIKSARIPSCQLRKV
jgi:hypothetical protein